MYWSKLQAHENNSCLPTVVVGNCPWLSSVATGLYDGLANHLDGGGPKWPPWEDYNHTAGAGCAQQGATCFKSLLESFPR